MNNLGASLASRLVIGFFFVGIFFTVALLTVIFSSPIALLFGLPIARWIARWIAQWDAVEFFPRHVSIHDLTILPLAEFPDHRASRSVRSRDMIRCAGVKAAASKRQDACHRSIRAQSAASLNEGGKWM